LVTTKVKNQLNKQSKEKEKKEKIEMKEKEEVLMRINLSFVSLRHFREEID